MAYEACKIAIEHMTPVFFLSDGYIANGSEPWKFPSSNDLKEIKPIFATEDLLKDGEKYLPYKRLENLSRAWAVPGQKGFEHRIGGIEKEHETGNVSYDPENHEFMVKLREAKVQKIADYLPLQEINNGFEDADLLILGWGSTYGAIKTAVNELAEEGIKVAHAHVKYLNPFPKNLEEVVRKYKTVLIPEINNGQLIKIIRDKYLIDAKGLNKIKGLPFRTDEIKNKVKELLA
jgi:2-oxoglutarate ferredoxin oxidoreductase subunit alpha